MKPTAKNIALLNYGMVLWLVLALVVFWNVTGPVPTLMAIPFFYLFISPFVALAGTFASIREYMDKKLSNG